jgi:hypothetical protein
LPPETADVLLDRLLIQTLALGDSEPGEDLTALLTERERTIDSLKELKLTVASLDKLTQVMQAERSTLQRFAFVQAQAVRELDRRANGRRLASTYRTPMRAGAGIDAQR